MIDVGYKNFIDEAKITEILKPDTSRSKWVRKEAVAGMTLIDCTEGRKTNCIILLKTGHTILSSIRFASLIRRLKSSGFVLKKKEKDIKKDLIDAMEKI
ncbi:MAG: hypothetical protein A2086_10950 [Spirochaetes bacterium GWD1_27_9]|nr:MAG: hypothetical protein A2Z98_00080 [Spirochaetes bacterium GWB1_27_13]OHD20177.1 MAG: hypothetical protein A2Y34_05070 [Spirochaetes bacterium GWC1_27_15]OHD41270.1 MAG: hypothetical protein A2086_10950 [Spirochaetes bacterium GWD1_27_9]